MRWMALALSYNGLLALCLAMPKHYRQVIPHAPTGIRRHLFRIGGWLALNASLAVSVIANGWSFGPLEWVGMLAVTGLALVFLLPYAPRAATALGIGALLSVSILMLL